MSLVLCGFIMLGMVVYAEPSSITTANEYELWTQSPTITCGLTNQEMRIYKAMDQNAIELYPLTEIGENYFLAICTEKMRDGGYSGTSKTSYHYFYTLYATDDGLIILSSESTSNEYFWDRGFNFANIAGKVNKSYYTQNASEVPCYIINPEGKYSNSNYDEYDEYMIITDKGTIYKMSEWAEYGTEGYPYIKDRILYRGQNKYKKNSSTYPFYYMPDGSTKASNSTPIYFKNGSMSYGTAKKVAVDDMTAENGYDLYTEGFDSNVSCPQYQKINGSNNLYFVTSSVKTYDNNDSRYYYYLRVDLYQSDGNNMNFLRTVTVPTTKTSSTTYTCLDLTGLDTNYYTSKGMPVPAVAVGTEAIIMQNGTVAKLSLDSSIYKNYYYIGAYNNRLAIVRSYTGSKAIYKYSDALQKNCYWQAINEVTFDSSGNVYLADDLELEIQSDPPPGQNGYFSKYNIWNKASFPTISTATVKSWWGRNLTNVFPDGRYVKGSWTGVGNGIYELWYEIYNADGTVRAVGPTGYSGYFGSSFDTKDLTVYAINNSKFVVALSDLGSSFLKEYYRVAVVEESDTGEITSKTEVGEKSITPPEGADTEVIQPIIDFGKNDLPIGFNIKDNAVDTDKLETNLREQVNAIRLNDIVILKKDEYQSGSQNTGVTLSSFSKYDYSLGNSYVRIYTNGQYINWYCYSPETLITGTYNKSYIVGDKTVYVTIKVVQPPTNEGSTTVVF